MSQPTTPTPEEGVTDVTTRKAVVYLLQRLKGCENIVVVHGDAGRYIFRFHLNQTYEGGADAFLAELSTALSGLAPSAKPYTYGEHMVVTALEVVDVNKIASLAPEPPAAL